MTTTKFLSRGTIGAVVVLAVIQLVPYGWNHANPPVRQEPAWSSLETRALAKRACFDCHSNETRYPWYTHVAPVSWLAQRDMVEGRNKLNFSEWDRPQEDSDHAAEELRKGEMPLWFYVPLHREAKLTPAEREALAAGLQATIGERKEKAASESALPATLTSRSRPWKP